MAEMQGEIRRKNPVEVLTEGLNQHCDELHPKQARSLLLLLEKHGYLVMHESTMIQPDDGQDILAKWRDGKFERLDAVEPAKASKFCGLNDGCRMPEFCDSHGSCSGEGPKTDA